MSTSPTESRPDARTGPASAASVPPAGAADDLDRAIAAVDALLPQTQCTRCGFDGCLPYARALVTGCAPVNRCPPGGQALIARLSAHLDRPALPLDPDCGVEGPRLLARIEPDGCIGCTKCIQACPVDAIIGASKRMHTVLPALCTGCERCVPPCPTDCIRMDPLPADRAWTHADARVARARHAMHGRRLARDRQDDEQRLAAKAVDKLRQVVDEIGRVGDDTEAQRALARKRAVIERAMHRADERRASRAGTGARPADGSPA